MIRLLDIVTDWKDELSSKVALSPGANAVAEPELKFRSV